MVVEPGFAAALTAAQLVELGWALVVLGGGQAVGGWAAPPPPHPGRASGTLWVGTGP